MLTEDVGVHSGSGNPSPDPPKHDQDLASHRALVMKAFQDFTTKISNAKEQFQFFRAFQEAAGMFDEARLIAASERLQSSFLPTLRRQIICLFQSLDVSALVKDSHRQHRLILDNLAQLQQSLDEINSLIGPSYNFSENDLGDFPALTIFKYRHLIDKISQVKDQICRDLMPTWFDLFTDIYGRNVFREIIKSQGQKISFHAFAHSQAPKALALIDQLNEWFGISELKLLQEYWPILTARITQLLPEFIPPDARTCDSEDDSSEAPPENLLKLAQSILPIFKLSRLFFRKLSKTMAMKGFPDMDPSGANEIMGTAKEIVDELEGFRDFYDLEDGLLEQIGQEVQSIMKHFRSLITNLEPYLVPVALESNDQSSCDDSKSKSWLESWNFQFILVAQRFIDACTQEQ